MNGMVSLLRRYGRHALLATVCLALLFPMLWALLGSFRSAAGLYATDPLPLPVSLANYHVAVARFPLLLLLRNSLITAGGVTIGDLVIATLAGFAVVRFRFRGRGLVLGAVVVALLIPVQTLIVPQFLLIARLHWLDGFAGLIAPQLGGCALVVLLLRRGVQAIPEELFDAASLDGAGSLRTLWHVVLPLLWPVIGASAILVFITTWNEYLWPLLAAPSPRHTTIQVGLTLFTNAEAANPGPLLAAAALATLPVLIVYLVAARRITDAFLHSGLR